jgi:predicted pyridoxine 5'-phosphate oxidase superfamily flavin-nucleotide-binding protein
LKIRTLGTPTVLAKRKDLDHIDTHARTFIARSPIVMLATADAEGWPDASPRGGASVNRADLVGERHRKAGQTGTVGPSSTPCKSCAPLLSPVSEAATLLQHGLGDAPGFVVVEDAHTLLIPDRPGQQPRRQLSQRDG